MIRSTVVKETRAKTTKRATLMIKINMLGTLSFELNGTLLRPDLGQRGSLLVSYLIQFNGPHRRDNLLDLFWSDRAPDKARSAFNNVTWRVRKLLQLDPNVGGDKLRRIGDDLTLEPSD